MSEPTQLAMLTEEGAAASWPCPTCRGNRRMLRLLHPDERVDGGPLTEVCRCRTCDGQGSVPWNQDDHSVFPF